MIGNPMIATPDYSFRRAAHTQHDDGGIIATVREHSSANPTCNPIVVKLSANARRGEISCQRVLIGEQRRQLRQFAGCLNTFGFAHHDRIVASLRLAGESAGNR
jgi:hypothetical protein